MGDWVRNKITRCIYKVQGIQPSPGSTWVVGGKSEDNLQDVTLVGDLGTKRMAAAVGGRLMSDYWEKMPLLSPKN